MNLPPGVRLDRSLQAGDHPYLALLPGITASPALGRVVPDLAARADFLERAKVQIRGERGYAFVDVEAPCIVLSRWYYEHGAELDLYLDLLHEATHLRQLAEGFDLWDDRFPYVDRPTEVEGYAVAIEEGRRLGMSEVAVLEHLSNPWMSKEETQRLLGHVDAFLATGVLPNLTQARADARRSVRRPW